MYAISVLIFLCLLLQGIESKPKKIPNKLLHPSRMINSTKNIICDDSNKNTLEQINTSSKINKLEEKIKHLEQRKIRLENKISTRSLDYNTKYKSKDKLKFVKRRLKHARSGLNFKRSSLKRSIKRQEKCQKVLKENVEIGELTVFDEKRLRGRKSLKKKPTRALIQEYFLKLKNGSENEPLNTTLQRFQKNHYYICFEYENCTCINGFNLVNESICQDIDECAYENGGCESKCSNFPGSYKCSCPNGYTLGSDKKSCNDINECIENNGLCKGVCRNTRGSYQCTCYNLPGTILGEDKHECVDIDECKENIHGCSHDCINFHSGFKCDCPEGLTIGSDEKTCEDINECESIEVIKECHYGCKNEIGSYSCLQKNDKIIKNLNVSIVCPPLPPPTIGYFECSYLLDNTFKSIPKTICKLKCRNGNSDYMVICNSNMRWVSLEQNKNISCETNPN